MMKMIQKWNKNVELMDYSKNYHGFFSEISTITSYMLAPKNKKLFRIECNDGIEVSLLGTFYRDISFKLEKSLSNVINDLLMSGKIYLQIKIEKNDLDKTRVNIEIGELNRKTYKKEKKNGISKELIVLNIKDVGYTKRYFRRISKKLDKYDITSNSEKLLKDEKNYNFDKHREKSELKTLKITRNFCLVSDVEGLSDSYILHKTIQQNSFKMLFVDYILEKVNNKIDILVGKGYNIKILTNYRIDNYSELWKKYTSGDLTLTEMNDILY